MLPDLKAANEAATEELIKASERDRDNIRAWLKVVLKAYLNADFVTVNYIGDMIKRVYPREYEQLEPASAWLFERAQSLVGESK